MSVRREETEEEVRWGENEKYLRRLTLQDFRETNFFLKGQFSVHVVTNCGPRHLGELNTTLISIKTELFMDMIYS
jgi:hypothetical protein